MGNASGGYNEPMEFKSMAPTRQMAKRPDTINSKELERFPLQFANVVALKWTRDGKIMFVTDHVTNEGTKLAASFVPEYLCKSLNADLVERKQT